MGPQDQKWKSMYYETANKADHSKVSQIKERFERHLGNDLPSDDFQSPFFQGSEQDREVKRQNDFLKRYNEELMRKYRESKTKGTPLYSEDLFFHSSHSELKHLVASSEHIAPLIKTLDEENELLKGELRSVSADLSSFIDIVNLLINENRELRDHITMKNLDFKKLIETIGMNDGEHIQELKHKIHIISEENNILIKHLDEMKKFKDGYDNFVYEKEQEMVKARDVYEQLNYDLEESRKREEHACRQLALMEPKYKDLNEGILQREQDIEDLKHELNKLENQNRLLGSQLDLTKKALKDLEAIKGQENDQLLQENTLLSHSLKDLKTEVREREKQVEAQKEELARVKRDKDEIGGILDETSSEIAELKTQLGLHMSRAEQSVQRERETSEKNESLIRDLQRSNGRVQQLEKQVNLMLESQKNELQAKHLSYEKLIEKLKGKQREHLAMKEEEIDRLMKELDGLKRLNETERKERQTLKDELNDLRDKGSEFEQQKAIEQQKLEISFLKKEIATLKGKNEQLVSKIQEDHRDELEGLKKALGLCNEEKEKLRRGNDDIIYELNQVKKENIELSNINKELLETHDFLKAELQKYTKTQPETFQGLISENRELREAKKILERQLAQQPSSIKPETGKLDESFRFKELEQKNKEMVTQISELSKRMAEMQNASRSGPILGKRGIFESENFQNPYLFPSPAKQIPQKDMITGPSPQPLQSRSWLASQPSHPNGLGNQQSPGRGARGESFKRNNFLSNEAYLSTPDNYL